MLASPEQGEARCVVWPCGWWHCLHSGDVPGTGAGAALDVSRLSARDFAFEGWPQFRVAVAYYPPCQFADTLTKTPTLLLLAEQDDWTPPAACLGIARDTPNVTAKVYPGAAHAFDQPGPARNYLGHRLAYDPAATSAAMQEALAFLDRELRAR